MAKKIHKTFESFVANKDFKFEPAIIDPILNCIKEHQVYLTQTENLPQLAKLGYMYNTLWYAGRVCWGYDGILRDGKLMVTDEDGEEYEYSDCEDNPKYKIEMCDPENDEIENLIYDAWGMHVSDGPESSPTFEQFKKLILEGKEVTDFDIKMRKPKKTFDEWVDVLTDKRYKYHSLYNSRREVANNLLCTIGTGYGLSKDGFIIKEASGADQDEDGYGFWENAEFLPEIQEVVDKILATPELEHTLEANYERMQSYKKKERAERRKSMDMFYDILKKAGLYKDEEGDLDQDEVFDRIDQMDEFKGKLSRSKSRAKEYHAYYPISSSSKINTICDPEARKREGVTNVDPSYIKAAKEICYDILAHIEIENKAHHGENNGEYAKKYLAMLGEPGFELEKTTDKYQLLEDIKEYFTYVTDGVAELKPAELNQGAWGKDNYYIMMKDTAKDSYGDNNYYIYLNFSPEKSSSLPKGGSNDVDYLKSTSLYEDLKSALDRVEAREEVKYIEFHFDNDKYAKISIVIHTNPKTHKYAKENIESNDKLRAKGFVVGQNTIKLTLDKAGLVLQIRKPQSLGSTHPDNKSGEEYFSNALQMEVSKVSGGKVCDIHIDERGFNTCHCNHMPSDVNKRKIVNWINSEHAKMKASDPAYGVGKKEGKKKLYAHNFMLWLKDHQDELK